ncbi:MAG TPA: hypothetical protein VHO91_12300 [Rhodopila sp.]|nr:hypothetical protein [Rhodopila sp.]
MRSTLLLACGAAAMLAAGSAQAQTQTQAEPHPQSIVRRQGPSMSGRTTTEPFMRPTPPAPPPGPRTLFKIGNLPVVLWAPVQPPYDSRANRNAAANPLWYGYGADSGL